MFEHLTERARQVVVLAEEEARILQHNYMGSEHILLGLLREEEGVAARVLESLGITVEEARARVVEIVDSQAAVVSGQLPRTPGAEKVLELARHQALGLGHHYIRTEHILLGLVLVPDTGGLAIRILLDFDADSEAIRNEVIRISSEPGGCLRNGGRGAWQDEREKSSMLLDQLGRNLTKLASEGLLDALIGRETEIERSMKILSQGKSLVLIGAPGVGTSAVVEGLAQRITSGEVPELLKHKQIYALDLPALVAGLTYIGECEEPLQEVVERITRRGDIILFIDELQDLVVAGADEGVIDAASILRAALARGELQTIGATTLVDEAHKYVDCDATLERRFEQVKVGEPSREDCVRILKALRYRYEAHFAIDIRDDALAAAVELADRYSSDRFLPDKALHLIDEASARACIRWGRASAGILDQEIEWTRREVGEEEVAEMVERYERHPFR
jgi:ATP-dependent Clp protease ATP-binding subunit ClpC